MFEIRSWFTVRSVVCGLVMFLFSPNQTAAVGAVVNAERPVLGIEEEGGFTYVVKSGDNLGTIAKRMLKEPEKYTWIVGANPKLYLERNRWKNFESNGDVTIYTGEKLFIPEREPNVPALLRENKRFAADLEGARRKIATFTERTTSLEGIVKKLEQTVHELKGQILWLKIGLRGAIVLAILLVLLLWRKRKKTLVLEGRVEEIDRDLQEANRALFNLGQKPNTPSRIASM